MNDGPRDMRGPLEPDGAPTAGEVLARIRYQSRDEAGKGRWFEDLFMRVARQEPELEAAAIRRWAEPLTRAHSPFRSAGRCRRNRTSA